MRDWMKLIPEEELRFYKKAGFLGELKPGRRAALIVVDVTMGFCGSKGATLDEAVAEYSTACGPASWVAMPKIAELIALFRTLKLPIIYSLSDLDAVPFTGKATKGVRTTTRDLTTSRPTLRRVMVNMCCRRRRPQSSFRRRSTPIS